MAPADLLGPLEGQRAETLRVIDTLADEDLDAEVPGDGRTVRQLLCHLVNQHHGVNFAIAAAIEGEVLHLSPEGRADFSEAEYEPAPAWNLARIRHELEETRDEQRRTFERMTEEDLDRPIRWPEWAARTVRSSIPYMLEHEDSHLDDLKAALQRV
jgi:uncharacterized damage-inducible protein DinB